MLVRDLSGEKKRKLGQSSPSPCHVFEKQCTIPHQCQRLSSSSSSLILFILVMNFLAISHLLPLPCHVFSLFLLFLVLFVLVVDFLAISSSPSSLLCLLPLASSLVLFILVVDFSAISSSPSSLNTTTHPTPSAIHFLSLNYDTMLQGTDFLVGVLNFPP